MSKIEPIILDSVKYNTSTCVWQQRINMDEVPSSKVEDYKPRPEDWRSWDKSPHETHIVKFSGLFERNSVVGPNSWHSVRVYEGEKTFKVLCHPLSLLNFIEIWQRSNSVLQVRASYKANHSAGYCISGLEAKARGLRKVGVPLKKLPYRPSAVEPDTNQNYLLNNYYLAEFAASFLSKEGESHAESCK